MLEGRTLRGTAIDLLQGFTTKVLPLLWRARLSWLRIALTLYYGGELVTYVRRWRNDAPDLPYHGWALTLIPDEVREFLLGNDRLAALLIVALVGLIVIGLGTRPALVLLVAMGIFIHAVKASAGTFEHSASLPTQVLLALAFVPGTNAVSLEHVIRWWRAGRKDLWGYLAAPYRTWGIYLILGLVAITYTASGLSKLRFGGVKWMDGETLGFYLRGLTSGGTPVYVIGGGPPTWRDDFGLEMYTYGNYRSGGGTLASIADWIGHTPAMLVAISVATIVLEICGFLLFVPRLRSLLLIGYICMHAAIGALMRLGFPEYQIICLFLIEWELIGVLIARLRRARPKLPPEDPVPLSSPAVGRS